MKHIRFYNVSSMALDRAWKKESKYGVTGKVKDLRIVFANGETVNLRFIKDVRIQEGVK